MKQQPLSVCQEGKGRVRFTITHRAINTNSAKRVLIKYKIKANYFYCKVSKGKRSKNELFKPNNDFGECGVKGREEMWLNFFCPGIGEGGISPGSAALE